MTAPCLSVSDHLYIVSLTCYHFPIDMYTLKPYTLALKEISPIKFSAVTTQPVEFDAMPALCLMDISINTGWVFTACCGQQSSVLKNRVQFA